jgi:dipeptidyl aminopeptidase/acylaminoacyl peptidase
MSSSLPLLRTEHCLDLRFPADPQLSADGQWLAYVRRRFDRQADVRIEEVCALHLRSGERLELGRGHTPRWAHSSTMLAFIDGAAGQHRIQQWRCGARAEQVTTLAHLPQAPQGLAWSPDDAVLAFTMFVSAPHQEPLGAQGSWQTLRTPQWASAPVVTEALVRRLDGLPSELQPGHHHIFLLHVEGGSLAQLTQGPWDHGGPRTKLTKLQLAGHLSWTPEGRHLIMSMQRHDPQAVDEVESLIASDVYEFDVQDATVRRLTRFGGPVCQAQVSPDGRWIAFVGFRDTGKAFHTNVVHIVPREGGEPRPLPHPQAMEVHSTFRWRPDSQAVLALLPERGAGCLVSVDLEGRWETLSRDVGGTAASGYVTWERHFSVSTTGSVAFLQGSPQRTDEVALLEPQGTQTAPARVLTQESAWLDNFGVASVEELELTGSTPVLQAWLIKPDRADKAGALPLIVWLHGGPYSAWGPDFAIAPQLWAARGYAVLMVNPRGSLGYGEEFTDLLHHDFPGLEDLRLLDAVEEAVEFGGIDPQRVFVAGESGGAVLTSWLISHSQRFSAAAMLYGVVDWVSMALTADRCDYFPNYWFPAPPTHPGMREHYWQRSPLAHVEKVRTPTLLLCGDQDWRTPLSQSEMYYTALKMQGTESALARFPGASHGLDGRPSHQMATIDMVVDWFDRYSAAQSPTCR